MAKLTSTMINRLATSLFERARTVEQRRNAEFNKTLPRWAFRVGYSEHPYIPMHMDGRPADTYYRVMKTVTPEVQETLNAMAKTLEAARACVAQYRTFTESLNSQGLSVGSIDLTVGDKYVPLVTEQVPEVEVIAVAKSINTNQQAFAAARTAFCNEVQEVVRTLQNRLVYEAIAAGVPGDPSVDALRALVEKMDKLEKSVGTENKETENA